MLDIGRVPIHRKLTLMGFATSAFSLLLACAALFAFDLATYKDAMVRRVRTQAEIVAYNAGSAVVFGDPRAATETLSALQSDPRMVSARIYDTQGRLFASALRPLDDGAVPERLRGTTTDSERFLGDELHVYQPIVVDGEAVGTLHIRLDASEVHGRIVLFATIAGIVLLVVLSIASVVHSRLQRLISTPLVQLARMARAVTSEKDYAVRATSQSEDEISDLVSAFNEMLSEIQRRELELERQTEELQAEVSARVLAQTELARRAEELARSNRELESFAYVASHDLQEPLRMVASYTQLLAEDYRGRLDDEADEYIDFAVDGAKRMQQLIQALLSYSRVSTQSGEPIRVDTGEILDEVERNLSAVLEETGATIERGPLPELETDPAKLTQVLQNLLQNALKYRRGRPEIRVTARPECDEWVFAVEDNGIGIDPRYRERVFMMFQRLHTQSEYEGTGIGLAICSRIVESQGGRIWVESEPGRGSTFYFTIPFATGGLPSALARRAKTARETSVHA